jgi:carbon monoxide dehydrogenase subunit G
MEMQGQRRLPLDQALVWAALNDPEVLKVCVPGCEKFEIEGEGAYTVVTALKIGPVSARFTGKVKLSDVQPPASYTLGFEGQGGVAGFGKGTSAVRLEPVDGGCELHYTVSATVGGKIAQLGQRLIDGVARSLADDFFKRFEAELLRRNPPPADEGVSAEVEPVAEAQASGAAPEGGADVDAARAADAGAAVPASQQQAQQARQDAQPSRDDPAAGTTSPGGSSSALPWIVGAVAAVVIIWLVMK